MSVIRAASSVQHPWRPIVHPLIKPQLTAILNRPQVSHFIDQEKSRCRLSQNQINSTILELEYKGPLILQSSHSFIVIITITRASTFGNCQRALVSIEGSVEFE